MKDNCYSFCRKKKESKCDIPEIILRVQCASLAMNSRESSSWTSRIHLTVYLKYLVSVVFIRWIALSNDPLNTWDHMYTDVPSTFLGHHLVFHQVIIYRAEKGLHSRLQRTKTPLPMKVLVPKETVLQSWSMGNWVKHENVSNKMTEIKLPP